MRDVLWITVAENADRVGHAHISLFRDADELGSYSLDVDMLEDALERPVPPLRPRSLDALRGDLDRAAAGTRRVWLQLSPPDSALAALDWEQWLRAEHLPAEFVRACPQPNLPIRMERPHVALIAATSDERAPSLLLRQLAHDAVALLNGGAEVSLVLDPPLHAALRGAHRLAPGDEAARALLQRVEARVGGKKLHWKEPLDDSERGLPVASYAWLQRAVGRLGSSDGIQLYVEGSKPYDGGLIQLGEVVLNAGDAVRLSLDVGAHVIGLTSFGGELTRQWCTMSASTLATMRGGPLFMVPAADGPDSVAAQYHLAALSSVVSTDAPSVALTRLFDARGITYGHPVASVMSQHVDLEMLSARLTKEAARVQLVPNRSAKRVDQFARDAHELLRAMVRLPPIAEQPPYDVFGWEEHFDRVEARAGRLRTPTSTPEVEEYAEALATAALRRHASRNDTLQVNQMLDLMQGLRDLEDGSTS